MDSQETQHSKNNLEKDKRWRTHTFILQNIKQNYNNQASFVVGGAGGEGGGRGDRDGEHM